MSAPDFSELEERRELEDVFRIPAIEASAPGPGDHPFREALVGIVKRLTGDIFSSRLSEAESPDVFQLPAD